MAWLKFMGFVPPEELRPSFAAALRHLDGSWTIEINRELVGGWWLLILRRDDGFERTLLLSPREQSPTLLHDRIEETFRTVPIRVGSARHGLPPGVRFERRAIARR
jgi:hypothetical protein